MCNFEKVLFPTNCEHGQSNVVLAMAHQLLEGHDVDVHFASWVPLDPRLWNIFDEVPKMGQITFHLIPGLKMFDAVLKNFNPTRDSLSHAPGYAGATCLRELMPQMLAP